MSARRSVTNHGRIRRAAVFMLLALGAEAASLAWKHPLSLYVFGAVGVLMALLSAISLALSLVSRPAEMELVPGAGEHDEARRVARSA